MSIRRSKRPEHVVAGRVDAPASFPSATPEPGCARAHRQHAPVTPQRRRGGKVVSNELRDGSTLAVHAASVIGQQGLEKLQPFLAMPSLRSAGQWRRWPQPQVRPLGTFTVAKKTDKTVRSYGYTRNLLCSLSR